MSLASVLVMWVKRRMFVLKVAASASAAALRFASSVILQEVQRRLDRQLLAVDVEAEAAIVSSKRRFQAPRPVTDFSWKSCSTRSSSW